MEISDPFSSLFELVLLWWAKAGDSYRAHSLWPGINTLLPPSETARIVREGQEGAGQWGRALLAAKPEDLSFTPETHTIEGLALAHAHAHTPTHTHAQWTHTHTGMHACTHAQWRNPSKLSKMDMGRL